MEEDEDYVNIYTFTHLWKQGGKLYSLSPDMPLPFPINFMSAVIFLAIFVPFCVLYYKMGWLQSIPAWGIALAVSGVSSWAYDKPAFGGRTVPQMIYDHAAFLFEKKSAYDLIDGDPDLGASEIEGKVFVPDFDPMKDDIE